MNATYAQLVEMLARRDIELAAANRRIDELLNLVAQLNDRVGELLAIAKRKKRATPKPTPEPGPPPDVAPDQRQAFEDRPKPPEPPTRTDDAKVQSRPGRKPLPTHLEVVEGISKPGACGRCASARLVAADEVIEEKLDVVAHQRIRRTVRKTCRCLDCGARTTGEAPPSPFPRSKVTCEWLAWLVVQKFQLAVPLDRVRRYLGTQGVGLTMSFLVNMIERAADLLSAIDGEHWKQLLANSHLASDGTGLKVQVPGFGLHHGHLEAYHWGDVVCFQYEADKGSEAQQSKLGRFSGTLLVDAESRYNLTFSDGRVLEAGCNAHGRRKFRDAEVAQPGLAAEGGRFVSSWFELDEQGRLEGRTGPDLLAWRQEHIAPEIVRFRQWITAVLPTLPPADPVAKVLRYYQKHWTALTRSVSDPELPLDNSATEREFQFVAKIRLNSLFAGGTEGAHRAAVLLGISATCRRQHVDLGAYLTWVFERTGTDAAKYRLSAADLTPAAFVRAVARHSMWTTRTPLPPRSRDHRRATI